MATDPRRETPGQGKDGTADAALLGCKNIRAFVGVAIGNTFRIHNWMLRHAISTSFARPTPGQVICAPLIFCILSNLPKKIEILPLTRMVQRL